MGATTFHSIKTNLALLSSINFKQFLHGNMHRITSSLRFFMSIFTFYVIVPISRLVSRFQDGNNSDNHRKDDGQVGSNWCGDSDVVGRNKERDDSIMESVPMASTNRYEYLSGNGISSFVQEPETLSFTIHEFFELSNTKTEKFNPLTRDEGSADKGLSLEQDYTAKVAKKVVVYDNVFANEEHSDTQENELDNEENIVSDEDLGCVGGSTRTDSANDQLNTEETEELDTNSDNDFEEEAETFQIPWSWEEYSLSSDPEEGSVSSNDELFSNNGEVGSFRHSFLTNKITEEGLGMPESPDSFDVIELEYSQEAETIFQPSDSDDEFIELEPHNEFFISLEDNKKLEIAEENVMKELVQQEAQNSESFHENTPPSKDVEVETELTYEHEDIIEQLKNELKVARTGGLPTIEEEAECEEVETPKIMPQLKPLKIDEKNEFKHCMDEIHMIYKSYNDRMRKLDILNFQTMHAIGLLQMKDAVESQTKRKASVATMKALLSHPLWSCKGSAVVEPMKKVVADVHRDLEAVYVGQLCLSWEVIHWQYRKAQELRNYDTQELRRYNQVAGEFQLFQVLLQRFVENEPFQGPRVQNYAKNRCVVRNLLQVPLINDDNSKDKERREDYHESAITQQMLLAIIEESIRTFWEFLRGDKDEFSNSQAPISFTDSVDSELLLDVLSDLQKKEKKLKELSRSGNCIIKKLHRSQEEEMARSCDMLLGQVELKLICRVTNMSKLTNDQLMWCHDKLGKMKISSRKVLLEPSFMLFPC